MIMPCVHKKTALNKGQMAALVAIGAAAAGAAATLHTANRIVDECLTHLPVIATSSFYEELAETMPGTEGLQFAETRLFVDSAVKQAQAQLYTQARVERVTIPAAQPSQRVVAYVYQPHSAAAGNRWVILAHGLQSDHYAMDGIANAYVAQGFNVLSCDLRGHGESDGGYVGMGALEASDLSKWVGYILARFGEECQIVLHGQGLGAVACLIAAGDGLPSQVKAVVSDTAYTSALAIIRRTALRANRPGDVLAVALRALMLARAHVDLKRADALAAVRRNTIPVLFLQGANDPLVPSTMAVELYTKATTPLRDLRVLSGAGHYEDFAKDPATYGSAIEAFLERTGVTAE